MLDNLNPPPKGFELAGGQERITRYGVENTTFFPKSVHLDDIDRSVQERIKSHFDITTRKGDKMFIADFQTLNRFTEYMNTWMNTDSTNTIKLPFLSLVRNSIIQKGTNLGGSYNIPNSPTFALYREPKIKNGKLTYDYYQIPQPVNVDIQYSLHLFTTSQWDLNQVDELVLHTFSSSQFYITVNGLFMPLKLEGLNESSNIDAPLEKRFYQHIYELTLKGYLLDEKQFKKVHSLDKITVMTESETNNSRACDVAIRNIRNGCETCLDFNFTKKTSNIQEYRSSVSLLLEYDNISRNMSVNYFVNNQPVSLPFELKRGDTLKVVYEPKNRIDFKLTLCGNAL